MTYEPVNLVYVSLDTDEIGQKVGRLAIKNRTIYSASRLHVHTLSGFIHADHRLPSLADVISRQV